MVDAKKPTPFRLGTELHFENVPLYRTSTYPTSHRVLNGKFFLYDAKEENGRFKIVASKRSIRFKPESMVIEGWVSKDALINRPVE